MCTATNVMASTIYPRNEMGGRVCIPVMSPRVYPGTVLETQLLRVVTMRVRPTRNRAGAAVKFRSEPDAPIVTASLPHRR